MKITAVERRVVVKSCLFLIPVQCAFFFWEGNDGTLRLVHVRLLMGVAQMSQYHFL
jgi:hypothetical protein